MMSINTNKLSQLVAEVKEKTLAATNAGIALTAARGAMQKADDAHRQAEERLATFVKKMVED